MSPMRMHKTTRRSFKGSNGRFDYVDPVDDVTGHERNATMANLSQMKFHEMKVEREPFEHNERRGKNASTSL